MPEERFKILLAEDDLNLGVLLVDYLETEGFDVKLCKDGELALKAFQGNQFDLCLLDVMMPKMDGRAVIMELKLDESTRNIPIIVLTAISDSFNREFTIGLGASDYITKPVEPSILLKKNTTINIAPLKKSNPPLKARAKLENLNFP